MRLILSMDQDNVITAFVSHLKDLGHPVNLVDRWPDKENRSSKDIDAVSGNFAIEHTSIDAVDDLRQRNDWFMKAAGELESELNPSMKFRLRINFDYESVDKGQDWKKIKNAIREWITTEAPLVSEGGHVIHIPDVPFELRIEKVSNEPPALIFSRSFNKGKETLESSIGPLVQKKAKKLAPYVQNGMVGILLIQTEDIAFMNRVRFAEAIRASFPIKLPDGVDQIWYADATIRPYLSFYNITALIIEIEQQEI